jgi:hypothetical protein
MNRTPLQVQAGLEETLERIKKSAPRWAKCVFFNAEFHQTEGGLSIGADQLAIVKKPFGSAKRTPFRMDGTTYLGMKCFGQGVLGEVGRSYVIVDFILDDKGAWHVFRDDRPLKRLMGGDLWFNKKHLEYVDLFPILASVT